MTLHLKNEITPLICISLSGTCHYSVCLHSPLCLRTDKQEVKADMMHAVKGKKMMLLSNLKTDKHVCFFLFFFVNHW